MTCGIKYFIVHIMECGRIVLFRFGLVCWFKGVALHLLTLTFWGTHLILNRLYSAGNSIKCLPEYSIIGKYWQNARQGTWFTMITGHQARASSYRRWIACGFNSDDRAIRDTSENIFGIEGALAGVISPHETGSSPYLIHLQLSVKGTLQGTRPNWS